MTKAKENNNEIDELTDTLKRVQADFINYKNRVEKEKQDYARFANDSIVSSLLPILDSFELALKNTENHEDFVKGIELVFAQLYAALKSQGLETIDCVGQQMDPYKHEVLLKEESDKEDGTIIEELQKGYLFKGKVLRHSKVKISSNDKETDASSGDSKDRSNLQ